MYKKILIPLDQHFGAEPAGLILTSLTDVGA